MSHRLPSTARLGQRAARRGGNYALLRCALGTDLAQEITSQSIMRVIDYREYHRVTRGRTKTYQDVPISEMNRSGLSGGHLF
jgi:hypothetical protein